MPRRKLLLLLACVATALSADAAAVRAQCPESQRLGSLVAVRFARFVETESDKREAVLRLVNESSCGVVVRVLSRPIVVGGGRIRFIEDSEELPDGALATIDYTVHRPQLTGIIAPPSWGGGCVLELMTLPAGRSLIFRVPVTEFESRYDIAVPFHFVGESSPRYQTFFHWSELPEPLPEP